ncbi:hypothetical protein EV384_1408 [Micromonospora kangleipakensis]|uniref:Uncharacterized protein n=1 Tax=Micromonospora kangleipakensis TaxID=1077942 RepID=A0A4V2GCR4_9ACTN|nr:hypothetical protein EV384_1408 [Micromonospora kangleipakensis]
MRCGLLVRYRRQVIVEEHWWNGDATARGRRDVYIRTDGHRWEVQAQIGGALGRSKVQECPSRGSASILAGAWRGGDPAWRELPADRVGRA